MNELRNRTAIYCRLSQDDGINGDSSSIQTQRMMLEQYSNEHNLKIVNVYVDDGYSGLNYNRPGFQRLLNDVESGLIDVIVTKDLSRLGRDYIMTGYYTDIYFPSKNVRYIAVNDNIDTLHDNNDIAPFKNILNDMYAKDVSKKVKSAKRQRMKKGYYCACQPPYGYKVDRSGEHPKLVIDEDASKVVKHIFDLALTNIGVTKIANKLNEEGIVTPSVYKANQGDQRFIKCVETNNKVSKKYNTYAWNTNTVGKILRDIVYVGDMENHKYEVKNYKTKKRTPVPKDEHIIVRNTHEPIVSRSDFNKVQELIEDRHIELVHYHKNLFKSLLHCSNCGRLMSLYYNQRRDGTKIWRYRCLERAFGGTEEVNTIAYDDIYKIVELRLREIFKSIKINQEDFIYEFKYEKKIKSSSASKEETGITKRLTVIDKLIKKIYEDYVSERIDDDNYERLLNEYQSEQKSLKYKLNEITTNNKETTTDINMARRFTEVADKYLNFTELTKEMINDLIDHIEISPLQIINGEKKREVKIVYRFVGQFTN